MNEKQQLTREQSETLAWNAGYLAGSRDTAQRFYRFTRAAGTATSLRMARVRHESTRISGQNKAA